MMRTALKMGPADHDRPLTLEEFTSAVHQEGYHYELIRGRVYVSPVPNLPQVSLEGWISDLLRAYIKQHPDVINHLTNKGRVFVPGEEEMTAPEPDAAVYRDFPHDVPFRERRWQDVSPILVVEVLSEDDPDKDLVRNVELYLLVPSIREYWILDGRADPDHPTLWVYRRRGQRWLRAFQVTAGGSYSTRLLPGFTLLLDPHA